MVEGLPDGRFVIHDRRAVCVQRGLRLRELGADRIGVDDREHLALFDTVIVIDTHLVHAARNFRADIDLVVRLQGARGADRDGEGSAGHLRGDITGRGFRAPQIESHQGGERSDEEPGKRQPPARPESARRQLQPQAAGEIGLGGGYLFVHEGFRRAGSS